jgi:protocatechuate 3,4-dioxygenase, alpha subunit
MAALIATGSQTVGPFFRFALHKPDWNDLTRYGVAGEAVRIEGLVFDGDGAGIPDALLEIWQADAAGSYEPSPLFRGFGRASTDIDGTYWFRTIVPGAVAGAGETAQAPHLNVTVFARGLLKRAITRIYFGDHAAENAHDPVLRSIPDAAARDTLIAPRTNHAGGLPVYRFDVRLQGEGETAFFSI